MIQLGFHNTFLMLEQMALIKWDEISRAIAAAQDRKDLNRLRGKVEAIRILAKQSRQSLQTQNKIAEFRLRIDRKHGERLIENIVQAGNGSNQFEKKELKLPRATSASAPAGISAEGQVFKRPTADGILFFHLFPSLYRVLSGENRIYSNARARGMVHVACFRMAFLVDDNPQKVTRVRHPLPCFVVHLATPQKRGWR